MTQLNNGNKVQIICTQPRRIAAISVAERVAQERSENCGQTIGYQVRLNSNYGSNTKILYCTTGIMLKKLKDSENLANLTHLIIDEVHERQVEVDFLMAILRREMPKYPKLKLVLLFLILVNFLLLLIIIIYFFIRFL